MNTMTKREYALLTQLQAILDDGVEQQLNRGRNYQRIFTLVGGITVLAAFYLAKFQIISGELGVMMAVIAGLALGMAGYIRIVRRVLSFIVPHLDKESIKTRLETLRQN